MGTLTDKQITAKTDKETWLTESAPKGAGRFAVRLRPNGERLFYFRYTNAEGKRDRYPIGVYDPKGTNGLSLKEARAKSGKLSRLYQSGILNIREHLEAEEAARVAQLEAELAKHQREQQAIAARKTVSELFEHWASIDLINRKDGGKEVRRMAEKDILPIIGHLAVEDVRKGHITEVTDKLLARGVNRMAKVIFSLMRQMFSFAVDRDMIEFNPTANIRKAKIGGKDTERDRILTDEEIRQLVHQLPNAGLLLTTEAAIWISLSTCCRIGELLSAEWQHIDLENNTWLIPEENSKNGKAHTVYLSPFAADQFKRLQTINGSSQWCYPNRTDSDHVCSKTITKQLTDRQRALESGVLSNRSGNAQALLLAGGRWTPHDLRRTGATMMTALGVLPEVADRCLNHTEENRVKRTYQRHSYQNEMRHAWELLGDRIELLLNTNHDNVITANFGKAGS